jgi:HSP20 family protein
MNMIVHTRNGLVPRRVDLFSEFSKEFDRISNEMFGAPFFKGVNKHKGYPLVDAIKKDDKLVLQYTVPGVKKDDLSVDIMDDPDGSLLVVSGKLSDSYVFDEDEYHIRELSRQDFRRIVRLPDNLEDENPQIDLCDGLLIVSFSLKNKEQSSQKVRRLKIN